MHIGVYIPLELARRGQGERFEVEGLGSDLARNRTVVDLCQLFLLLAGSEFSAFHTDIFAEKFWMVLNHEKIVHLCFV